MDPKAEFLLEILFDNSRDRFIRKTARDTLNEMGITDKEIGAFRHRREFKNDLDKIHTEMEEQAKRLYRSRDEKSKSSTNVLKLGIVTVIFFFLILCAVMFWGVTSSNKTDTSTSYEQTVESSEGNAL